MGYEFRESPSPLISVVWRAESDQLGEYTDAANEFWGLAFDRDPDGVMTVLLIGPSRVPRQLTTRPGELSWGVEFAAPVFLHRIPKLSLLGEFRPLPVDGDFFELAGVRFPITPYAELERLVDAMQRQGVLSLDEAVARALAGDDPAYSERQLRRRASAAIGLSPKQVEQLRRARSAYRMLQEGHTLAEAALAAGYSDQAHMTRSLRLIAGESPARILASDGDAFASRPST